MGRRKPRHHVPETATAKLLGRFARAIGIPVHDREVEGFINIAPSPPPPRRVTLEEFNAFVYAHRQADRFDPRCTPEPPPPAAPPAPTGKIPWRVILGFAPPAIPTADQVQERWRQLSKIYHPRGEHSGTPSGYDESFKAITAARDAALQDISGS
jgi:hypothetical protein